LVLHNCKVSKDGKTIIIGEFDELRGIENKRFIEQLCKKMFRYCEDIGNNMFQYSELITLRNLSDKLLKKYRKQLTTTSEGKE
jgi:hypothetical protein